MITQDITLFYLTMISYNCGWDSLVDYFNARTHDIWEVNVTTRKEI